MKEGRIYSLQPSDFKFNTMLNFSHKSNETFELSMVIRLLLLKNLIIIFLCKHRQVTNNIVSLCLCSVGLFNSTHSFISYVSSKSETQSLRAFSGFCVNNIYPPHLLISTNF